MSSAGNNPGLSPERPFPGLRPYRFEDEKFFFGREEQIFALYRLFDHSRFVAVVGSSGSGKSSLVRAGLLPLLANESQEPTGRIWKRVQMHPGDTPIGNLATAMVAEFFPKDDANVASGRRERLRFTLRRSSFGMSDALRDIGGLDGTSIVLVVDQFEELFRYGVKRQEPDDENQAQRHEEAAQFVQILLAASRDRALNVYVLLTMRSDFIGDCATFRGLPEAVSASQFLVPSLSRDQCEQAIRGPIEKMAKASIESELIERLLNDAGDQLDQLPVLQHCLARLWERAAADTTAAEPSRRLTMQHYQDVGEIAHALSWHADEILAGLAGDELAVEQTFRSLAEIDTEGRIIRRGRQFKELVAESGVPKEKMQTVVDRFRDEDCSFLTPPRSEGGIEPNTPIDVGHEALLRRWERVSGDPRNGSPYTGWLRAEEADGRDYRVLLTMAESKAGRIPPDQVETRWKWWNEHPRTAAWAARYGGNVEAVKRLFNDSLSDLKAKAARKEAEEAAERHRIELEAEAARAREETERARLELAAQAARDRELNALRFARLARQAAIGVSALLCITLALGVFSYVQWQTTLTERANVEKALKLGGDMTKDLLARVQAYLNDGSVSVKTAKDLLTTAQGNLTRLQEVAQTPAIQATRADLLLSFSDLYSTLQDDAAALQYSTQAQDLATHLVASDYENSSYQDLLYSADFRVGDAQSNLLNFDPALQAYAAALAIAQNMAVKDPATYMWMQYTAFIMNKVGDINKVSRKTGDALKQYQAALLIDQKLASDHPTDDSVKRDLATTATRIGDLQKDAGNLTGALANYQSALSVRKDLATRSPEDASLQSNLSVAYNRVADILTSQHNFNDAAPLYQEALTIRKSLADGDPTNTTWQSYLAFEYVYIGKMLMQQGDFAGAVMNYQQSLTIRKDLVGHDLKNSMWLKNLADSYGSLGDASLAKGDLAGALDDRRAALNTRLQIAAQNPNNATRHRELVSEYIAIGDIQKQQRDTAGAAASYQSALNTVADFVAKHPGSTALNSVRDAATKAMQGLQPATTNP